MSTEPSNKIFIRECVQFMQQLPDDYIDLTITSPPYDGLREYKHDLRKFKVKETIIQLFRITADGGVVVWVVGDQTIKGSETGSSFKQALMFMDAGFKLHDTMIFRKNGTGACGSNYAYWQSFEYMFVFVKGKIKTVNRIADVKNKYAGTGTSGQRMYNKTKKRRIVKDYSVRSNIWTYQLGNTSGDDVTTHPAVFPEALAKDHIQSWSNPGDMIFDPFSGSGTVAKMAQELERNYVGCDICTEYVHDARKRVDASLKKLLNGE